MSRQVMAAAIRGTTAFVEEAEAKFAEAVGKYGEGQKVEFPETAFYLPMIYALMGLEVKNARRPEAGPGALPRAAAAACRPTTCGCRTWATAWTRASPRCWPRR